MDNFDDLAELPSPTGADPQDTHFVQPSAWPSLMAMASDVSVLRTESLCWGSVDIIECQINDAPHILAHIRTIDGIPVEAGFAWHRETLKAELKAIRSRKELARASVFFGDVGLVMLYEDEDAMIAA